MNDVARREKLQIALLELVDKTLADKTTGSKLRTMLAASKVSVEDLKKEVLSYNLLRDEEGYENENYHKMVARLTLYFHNIVQGSYHQPRQEIILSFLEQVKPELCIDVGYGVPGPAITAYLEHNSKAKAVLLDQDPNAEEFATLQIKTENSAILPRIQFRTYDMDAQEYPGDAAAYLFLDSIEHTKHPTEYLHKIVAHAQKGSKFIFSIPICSMKGLENFHFAEWTSDQAAKDWLTEGGLQVINEQIVTPNPEVDFFAEFIEGGFHNYLVLCKKP